uniref:Uncharacterized protein n=1 Tax=Rhizophagus irregularis (strain DAOM 181602 / DAOM 197198 / MUCL 43194) TaxID=747089 RepID=U9T9F7_RHIID
MARPQVRALMETFCQSFICNLIVFQKHALIMSFMLNLFIHTSSYDKSEPIGQNQYFLKQNIQEKLVI